MYLKLHQIKYIHIIYYKHNIKKYKEEKIHNLYHF